MKKLLSLLVLMLAVLVSTVNAQDASDYLTPEQRARMEADIQAKELQKKLDTYGKWVGVGGEVGQAVREGLTAVGDVANDFGKTEVGKFTMFMIAWKVMGKEILRVVMGLLFFSIMTFIFIKTYKNTYQSKRVCVEVTNKGFLRKDKKYEVVEPHNGWEGYIAVKFAMLGLYIGMIGITYAIMFGKA